MAQNNQETLLSAWSLQSQGRPSALTITLCQPDKGPPAGPGANDKGLCPRAWKARIPQQELGRGAMMESSSAASPAHCEATGEQLVAPHGALTSRHPGDCSQQRPPRLTQQHGDACALTRACTYTHRHSSPLTGLLVRAALTFGDAGLPELPPASSWSMPPPTGAQVDGYLPARLFLAETHRLFSEAGGNEVDSCTPFPGGVGIFCTHKISPGEPGLRSPLAIAAESLTPSINPECPAVTGPPAPPSHTSARGGHYGPGGPCLSAQQAANQTVI